MGRDARQDRADDDADRAEQRGRHGDLAQPPPRRLQAALVEDRDEPDDADVARELGVVELDPARAVRAEQHPEREERDERRARPARAAPSATTMLAASTAPTTSSISPSSTHVSLLLPARRDVFPSRAAYAAGSRRAIRTPRRTETGP